MHSSRELRSSSFEITVEKPFIDPKKTTPKQQLTPSASEQKP
jgi:hypothetical protein